MYLTEGGNEFKLDDGSSFTKQDASSEEAKATAGALGKEIGIDLEKRIAGSILYPGAVTGDADTILDPGDFIKIDPQDSPKDTQNKFREWLAQKLQSAGYTGLPKKSTVKEPGKYYKIAGDGLTASVQIPGSSEWLQVDLDIAEPGEGPFSLWSKRGEPNEPGTPKDARAKGAYRHILLAAIGSILVSADHPQGLSWSYKNGLIDRATKETITKDPNEVAKILFGGTAADLENINAILAKFKQTHPGQYNDVIQKVNTGLESYKTKYRLKESHPVGSPAWFSSTRSKLEMLEETYILDEGLGDWIYKKIDDLLGGPTVSSQQISRAMARAPANIPDDVAEKLVADFLAKKQHEAALERAAQAQRTTVEKLKPYLYYFVGEFIDRWKRIPQADKRRALKDLALGVFRLLMFILEALLKSKR